MNNIWDYTFTNHFDANYYLPQNNFWTGNISMNFSIWDSFINTPFIMPQIFDFSCNNSFCFPNINFQLPIFQMPILNLNYTTPVIQQKPTELAAEKTDIEEDREPVLTDYDTPKPQEQRVQTDYRAQTVQPQTRSSNLGNSSFPVIAEEVLPGHFIHKGKYLNTKDLKPYMKEALVKLDQKATELGYTLVVVDGFRSHACQVEAKRRKPRLCATPGKSPHEYGVAVDIALYKPDGKQVQDIKREVPEFGQYAQSLDLEWGATWRTKYEPWHFNFNNWKELADVRDEYRSYNHIA